MKRSKALILGIILFLLAGCTPEEKEDPEPEVIKDQPTEVIEEADSEEPENPEAEVPDGSESGDAEDPEEKIIISSEFYFDGILDGKRVVFQDSVNHFLIDAGSGCTGVYDCGCCISDQFSGFSTGDSFIESEGAVKLEIIHLWFHKTFSHAPGGSDIDSVYSPGIYPYSDKDGVVIRYMDPNGKLWGSDAGDNSNGLLEVVNVENDAFDIEPLYQLHKIIEVRISCTLYPIVANLTLPKPKSPIKLEDGFMRVRASRH